MAAQVPAALKAADITRFAQRAAQLEKARPIVAYWCDYWIVNQILSKSLHNADQECLQYTTALMDKLEQFKSQHSEEPAVTDDIAGKAYVEQFGLETFSRADNAVRANKATKQTADTFMAAVTFLDLLKIWGEIDPEIAAKEKFAKYHAKRILLAIQAGKDPNESNPEPKPEPEEALPALDPNDAEVQALGGGLPKPRQASVVEVPDEAHRLQSNLATQSVFDESLHPSRETSIPPAPDKLARQPSVTEVPDDADRLQSMLAKQSSLNESLHPSRAPSLPRSGKDNVSPLAAPDASSYYTNQNGQPEVSPIISPERKPSIGGNYFPQSPPPRTDALPPPLSSLPSAPADEADMLDLPSAPSQPSLPSAPTMFTQQQPPSLPHQSPPPAPAKHHGHFLPQPQTQPIDPSQPPIIPPNFLPQSNPTQSIPFVPPQMRPSHGPTPPLPPSSATSTRAPTFPPQPAAIPVTATPISAPIPNAVVDEEAMMKAQKHARWAISALNFEDVPTAIRELRSALAELGSSS